MLAMLLGAADPAFDAMNPALPEREAYAACLARYHARELSVALDSGFDEVFARALARVSNAKCSAQPANVLAAQLRGSLFAAMYRRFGPEAGRSASNLITTWTPKLPSGDSRASWYMISACVVDKAPQAARDMVRAAAVYEQPAAPRARIIEALPRCLPGNMRVSVNLMTLIGYVAETVYQIDFAVGPSERKDFR